MRDWQMRLSRPILAFCLFVLVAGVARANVTLKIGVRNPSKFQEQETVVRKLLPSGITPAQVLDAAGLDVVYDEEAQQYAVTKKIQLKPEEQKTFEIRLQDIWLIDAAEVARLKRQAGEKADKLAGKKYEAQANELKARIDQNLATVLQRQEAAMVPKVAPADHISAYNSNKALIGIVNDDLTALEKLLQVLAGETTVSHGLKEGMPPNIGTIWKVIFIIISFVGVISVVFFVIWSVQLKKIRAVEKEEGLAGGGAG